MGKVRGKEKRGGGGKGEEFFPFYKGSKALIIIIGYEIGR